MKTLFVSLQRKLFLVIVTAVFLTGCQKVVSIDLNNANPRLVVEGIVTDQPGPYSVKLSMSGDYFAPSLYFPPVSNALIILVRQFWSNRYAERKHQRNLPVVDIAGSCRQHIYDVR